jgi:glycosyltransferase involved in cell wall biosynthesis
MPRLTVVIITFNEEKNIERCLESVLPIADEVVVLDSFSTDRTVSICQKWEVRVEQHAFDGHIQQKNRALELATHDWVLSLDADEALSSPLRKSIQHWKEQRHPIAAWMNRKTNYCGQWIHHSGWYPDRKLRLFNRQEARWGGQNPHDKIVLDPGIISTRIQGDLLHYSYYTVEEHLERARKYAQISAKAMKSNGKRLFWFQQYWNPFMKWIKCYLIRGGFRDGKAGWTICKIAALETYWKYAIALKS